MQTNRIIILYRISVFRIPKKNVTIKQQLKTKQKKIAKARNKGKR